MVHFDQSPPRNRSDQEESTQTPGINMFTIIRAAFDAAEQDAC